MARLVLVLIVSSSPDATRVDVGEPWDAVRGRYGGLASAVLCSQVVTAGFWRGAMGVGVGVGSSLGNTASWRCRVQRGEALGAVGAGSAGNMALSK